MKITSGKELNSNYSIQEVVERVKGEKINPRKKFYCPFCGGDDASIRLSDNVFTCWSKLCTERSAQPYRFLDVYFRKVHGAKTWQEVYKMIDDLLGTNLYKEFKNKKGKKKEQYNTTYKVDKYCSEIELDFFNDVLVNKRVLLKAGTGFGKSHMLAEGSKKFLKDRILDVDKVIFATARGSIVEEIGERGFDKFYKNEVQLPYNPLIATTTHKAPLLVQQLEETATVLGDGTIQWDDPKEYLLIVDECHLLLTSRNIVVKENKDLMYLKQLIDRAKYVIFTSANTEHFYNACKDIYDIKSYINIERNTPLYNLERLEIKRSILDRESRIKALTEDIKKEIENGNKVFMVHNNKKDLKQIEENLNNDRILAKVICADNKNSEDVYKDYQALIKKSVLSCDVTLCTSVVDTGVNIHESRVTTMLIQDQLSFDDVTTIQTFARVRVKENGFHGNKGILYLSDIKNRLEKHDQIHAIEGYLRTYKTIAKQLAESFNTHLRRSYDWESYEEYKDVWGLLRGNDMYSPYRHLLIIECEGDYNEDPILAIDDIAIYDASRRMYLGSNYFNDEFIKEVVKEISTKEVIFTKDLRKNIEKEEKVVSETFKDVLTKFVNDAEYYQIVMDRYVSGAELEEEPFYIEYLKTDHTSKFNKLDKRIKAMCNMIDRARVSVSKFDYAMRMIEAYANYERRDLIKSVREIEYQIYNEMYKDADSWRGLGDTLYTTIRKSFDKAVFNRNKLTDRALELFTIEYLIVTEAKKYYYDENDKLVKTKTKDKPVDLEKKKIEALEHIQLVYSISEKNYLSFL